MNFDTFWTKLETLEKGIQITSPVSLQVKRAYWGGPPTAPGELPCIINAMSEPNRVLGFGAREQSLQIVVQCLCAKATVEDERSSRIATAFWQAAKNAFDGDQTIGGTVSLSVLKGAVPTVPVILQHAGIAYIGFNAVLEILDVEQFTFG